jgi:hypothetical protein
MLLFALAALGVIGGYTLYNKSKSTGTPTVASNNAGSVTVGSNPANISQLGGGGGPAQSIGTYSSLAQTGVGLSAGLGLISKTGELAKAVPIVGAIIGIGLSIYAQISMHHKAALAAEGKALNDATPRAYQTLVLIVQAAISREITNLQTAQSLISQTISAYYGEVKPIQRGVWHFTGDDLSLDYDKIWIKRTQGSGNDYHAPDPCNGACLIGHFFIERGGKLAMVAVNEIISGRHGSITFPMIPAHETQQGHPAVTVSY